MDRVTHFEIPFDNQERAQTFYKDVFGWEINAVPGMPYWMVITTPVDEQFMPQEPGSINGGMYERGTEGSSSPVPVVLVESCEQRISDVEAAGGSKVFGPRQIGDMGIYAQVKDTENNIIGLWQSLK